uniref:Uncharacterized protein n=1 Tax=Rhizophora mucronata TaxID=61149 RepID=A0A2P2PCQ4_RHIMU
MSTRERTMTNGLGEHIHVVSSICEGGWRVQLSFM